MGDFSIVPDQIPISSITDAAASPIYNANRLRNMLIDPNLLASTISGQSLVWNGTEWTGVTISGGSTNKYIGIYTSGQHFNGPWPTIDPPSSTTGYPITIPIAGVYLLLFNGTADGSAAQTEPLNVEIWLDGVSTGFTLRGPPSVSHSLMVTSNIIRYINVGTHYIYYKSLGNTTSSSEDTGTVFFAKVYPSV